MAKMTTATLRKNAMTETYEDVRDLIFETCWKFQKGHGGDIEELIAEANKLFVLAYNSYNSEKSQFTTWVVTSIKNGLKTFIRAEWRQSHPSLSRIKEHNPYQEYEYTESFSVLELLDEMEKDAYIILQLFLDTPRDVFENAVCSGKKSKHIQVCMRRRLRNRLQQMGWTIRRITESFDEIAQVIQS